MDGKEVSAVLLNKDGKYWGRGTIVSIDPDGKVLFAKKVNGKIMIGKGHIVDIKDYIVEGA